MSVDVNTREPTSKSRMRVIPSYNHLRAEDRNENQIKIQEAAEDYKLIMSSIFTTIDVEKTELFVC